MKSIKSAETTPHSGQRRQKQPIINIARARQHLGKLAESAELLQQDLVLQAAFDSITDPISIVDLDFKIVKVNKAFVDVIGKEPDEIIGRRCYELVHGTKHPPKGCPHVKTLQTQNSATRDLFERSLGSYFQITTSPIFNEAAEITSTIHLMKNITGYKNIEEELRKSSQRYRNLVELTSDFIWEVDKSGVYTYVSPKIFDILGYTAREVIGKTPFDLMPPKEAGRVRQIFQQFLSQNTPFNSVENSNLHKDGHSVVLETSGVPFYDSDGNLQGYRGIDRDITQRKKAEEETRKAHKEAEKRSQEVAAERQRLFNVLDTLPAIVCLFTPDHHIKFANRAFREVYGEPGERFCYEYFGLSEPCKFCETHRVFKTGQPHHWEINAPDGKILDAYDFPFIDTDGSSLVLEMDIDITKRRKAEKALAKAKAELELKVKERTADLAESENKYRLVVDNADELIVVFQEKIVFVNKRGLEITGYSEAELFSHPFTDFIYPDDRAMMIERAQRRARGIAVPDIYEFRIIHKDGSTKWLMVHATSIQWQGKPATLGLMSDITIRKNMEDELKAYAQRITQVQEEERKRIAYELHDDTTQYLSILKMQLGSLSQSGEINSPKAKEKLGYLEQDADRAFQDVRRYSHELRPVILERSGLVAALEQLVEDYIKLGQLQVKMKVGGEEPELSEDVKLGFFRIAQEALNNTRKHAKASQANISISFRENQLEMSITDNGNGFDVRKATTRAGDKGSLGLMSMKERSGLIGADLKIESKPGQGTIIKVDMALDI